VCSWPFALFGYGSDHNFDRHLSLATERRLTAESYFKESWTSGTFLDTLPMTGGQSAMSSKPRQLRQAAAVHAGPGVALAGEERDAMIELIGATCSTP
jgi:hypothetical protein